MAEKIKQSNINEQSKMDMQRYAIYVARNRSIPEYKDGLKPVQRRILWDMYHDQKAINNTIKSARIMGDVVGKYHPHGDCLFGTTLVYDIDGNTHRIEDLYNNKIQSLNVLSVNKNTGEIVPAVAHSFRIGQYAKKIYTFILSNDATITCTGNHPIMDYKGNWIKAEDINIDNGFIPYRKSLNNDSILKDIYESLDEIFMTYGYIEYDRFVEANPNTNIDKLFFGNSLLPEYYDEYPVFIDVQVENLYKEIPMYDFTVDTYENMLIAVPTSITNNWSLICVHNSAVYGAMKPLTNWFEINEPLIVKQGNFGNFQGDGASAARYTEAKLSPFAVECVISELQETNKVVDWDDNYDNTLLEPSYLPAAVPLLLINGASGIATGLKVEIPSHNINEVIDATIALLHDPNADIVLVPDTCMPCEIVDSDWRGITNTGTGSFKVRGIIETSEYNGYPALIIRSIPDNTYLNTITEKIDELILNNKIVQIMKSIDKCTEEEIKFILQLKKGSDPEFVKQVLYKNTLLEKSYSVNFEVLDGITPVRLGYKSYLQAFIMQRLETKFRLYCNRLQDKQTRYHQVDAFIKVITSGKMDTVINMIKKQKSTDNSIIINYLVDKIKLTDLQAKFIINVQLYRLSAGYLAKYKQEAKELLDAIKIYERKIVDDSIIQKELEEELLAYKAKYGKPRKSKIISVEEATNIPAGQFKLVITENNFIKKIQLNDPIGNLKGDSPKTVLSVENRENILIFDELGKVYKLPVHKIAFSDRNSPGIDIRMVIKNLTANINSVFYEPMVTKFAKSRVKYFIVVLTKNGNIKRMDLDDIITATPSGIVYVKLEDGDVVQDIMILGGHSDVVVYNKNKALRIPCNDIPYLKRSTKGAKSMPNGEVEGLSVVTKDTTDIVVITNKGYINRLSPMALPATTRNKAPSKVIKLGKGDTIQAVYGVNVNDSIRVVSQSGTTEIKVADLAVGSSISTGAKVLATRSDMIVKTNIIKTK